MRIVSKNVTTTGLKGFENIGRSPKKVGLTRDGTLKAGNTWKGRLVSMLEPFGLFKEYCEKTKLEMVEENRLAAWTLWSSLVKKYGIDNAREALSTTNPSMHGMDGIKVRQGLLGRATVGNSGTLTCGEISSLMNKTKNISRMREQQIQQLHHHVPMTEQEASFYEPEHPHTAELSDAIQNHQRVIDFVGNKANLHFLLTEMNEDPTRLKRSRIEYITNRLLHEVGSAKREGVFSRNQIVRMAERALYESLQHNASWCQMQVIKMETNKRMDKPSKFVLDFAELKDSVTENANTTLTPEYVQDVGRELGIQVRKLRARMVATKVRKQVERRVTNERIALNTDDFKKMTIEALRS